MKQNSRNVQTVALFIITLLLHAVCAHREDYKVKQWQLNKFWWWSSDAPMTKALDEIPDVVNGIKLILDHFKRVEGKVVSELGSKTPRRHDALLRPCKSRDLQDRRGAAAQVNAKSLVSRLTNEGNFTRPTYVYNFRYDTTSTNCVLHPAQGIRVGEHWRTSSTIHNRPIEEALTLNKRQLFQEYHRVVDGHLSDNAIMRLPVRPNNGKKRVIRDHGTTVIVSLRGAAISSVYRNIPIAENPALLDSLEMASILIQQAEGAVTPSTPSNIAILVLPLALNLVPVALFANVTTIKMMLYIYSIWCPHGYPSSYQRH